MEVIRDTKDTSFKFSLGAAAPLLGSLIVAGFAVGAGLNLFAKESKASAETSTTPTPASPYTITTRNLKYDKATLPAAPDTDVSLTLHSKDIAVHNLSSYQ